jgi:AcrR family transcriptional regulator
MPRPDSIRQRMRRLIHEELTDVALELFTERGFDHVSVDDIAAAVGVSQRTFFRYFPVKEDVVLHVLDESGPIIRQALADRPADEPHLQALRHAFLAVSSAAPELTSRSTAVMRLAMASPRLMAGLEARQRAWEDAIANVLAARTGRTTAQDPTCRIWAAMALSVTFSSALWSVQNGASGDSRANVERAFNAVVELIDSSPPST